MGNETPLSRCIARQRLGHLGLGHAELPGDLRWLDASLEGGANSVQFFTLPAETPPFVAKGTVAKKDVKAVFLGRGESEVVSLNVRIEKVMPVEPPAVERESISIGELVDQLRSGAAAELRSPNIVASARR